MQGIFHTGRQSLTKLAAHIEDYYCYQIELTKAYSNHDWREDIKNMMLNAGLNRRTIVFLFSDTQVIYFYTHQ